MYARLAIHWYMKIFVGWEITLSPGERWQAHITEINLKMFSWQLAVNYLKLQSISHTPTT